MFIRDNLSSASLAYGAGISIKNLAGNAIATIDQNLIIDKLCAAICEAA